MNVFVRPIDHVGARLSIEVVYDLVCPWCHLGLRRLLRTLAARPDIVADIAWHPFLLNPDMPRAGMARGDYVVRKFGSEERARRLYASITEAGAREEVVFRFERIRRVPSSVDAHRLVRWAARQGRAQALVERLFAAHFAEGLDIGAAEVLAAAAAACGLDARRALGFLAGDGAFEEVHADNLRAHRLGVTGVPCFVIGGRHAIAGAQEREVLERLLDVALVEADQP